MEYLFMLFIFAGIAGLLVCVPISVSLWAVLGQSNFLFRLAAMIVCVLVVGAFFDSSSSAKAFAKIATARFFLILCLAAWAFQSWIARGFCVATLFVINRLADNDVVANAVIAHEVVAHVGAEEGKDDSLDAVDRLFSDEAFVPGLF